jgi:arsenate reductase (glutaredoxin)
MIIIYGIGNCDTVRTARVWLTGQGLFHDFYDFKKRGVPADRLVAWIKAHGGEKLLNRQGSTWRKLDAAAQSAAGSASGMQALMLANPSLIRRPVVEWGGTGLQITVGFDAERWSQITSDRAPQVLQ